MINVRLPEVICECSMHPVLGDYVRLQFHVHVTSIPKFLVSLVSIYTNCD